MSRRSSTCYLCGQQILEEPTADHVPPRQFFGASIRKRHSPNLLTLQTHQACNAAYKDDEEYFVQSVSPVAWMTYAGRSIRADIGRRYKREEGVRLGEMVLAEFEGRPSDLDLPDGMVVKRVDGARVSRVQWKIARGLFYYHHERYLPVHLPHWIKLYGEEGPPKDFEPFSRLETHGRYPAVFDYRFFHHRGLKRHAWALLLWDKVLSIIIFHDPECGCGQCLEAEAGEVTPEMN